MVLIIINYAVKIIIIALGILLLSGYLINNPETRTMTQIMGVVMILWGIYRVIMYRTQLKRYRQDDEEE